MTMVLAAAGFALFAWWASTGLILALDRLPRWTFVWTMVGATLLTALALAGLAWSAQETTIASALCAFACALVVWGWTEVSFLTGWITGPRTTASPPGTRGLERLGHAIGAIIWHEIAILVGFLVLLLVVRDAPNQVALWTYGVLWAMRLSAKLNIFLGVPNHAESFLPDHLRYLTSWFTKKPMNFFFPVSVSAALVVLAVVAQPAFAADATPFEAAAAALVATLLALGVLEHWFLVLPFDSLALWRPAFLRRPRPAPVAAAADTPAPGRARDDTHPAYSLWRR